MNNRHWHMESEKNCTHHYLLPATGITVEGVCKHCGHTRVFDNSIPETTYGGGSMTGGKAQAMVEAKRKRRGIVLEPKSPLGWVL